MKLFAYVLDSKEYRHLLTEIMFNVSSARSLGYELLMLKYPTVPADPLTVSRTERILKSLKKRSFIQYLVTSAQCKEGSEEAEYLYNKFPDTGKTVRDLSEPFCIVKL